MKSNTENQEVFAINAPGETIIRHGQAAPIREPRQLAYTGRLDSPRQFLQPKVELYDFKQATVFINQTSGTLKLVLAEKSELFDSVTGSLELAPELAQFKINTDQKYTVSELVKFLKRTRFFFSDKDSHAVLLSSLMNFSAKVQTKIEQQQSTNGSSKNNLEREVHGIEWNREFVLTTPIFKGYPAKSFRVEIGIDPTDASVKLYLESAELFELEQQYRAELLAEEAAYFEQWGCSVLYQS
ncbi:hypothetical protein D0N36_06815 [Hymenobacter lapidiphilus]|uniref:hypothetical protein n=1 Tax=Hymenobacter sp. CCM 8763 TaxID=2303334 RepID=UPI000E34DBB2|nr:hypothetical protein [Hymenobacter sp. CCM 8763]RFP65909.1 hypothetical protein D0N36_06815 [Hymenobacter sp. CCM 8763]